MAFPGTKAAAAPAMVRVVTECPLCGRGEIIPVPREGYSRWRAGVAHSQDAMPEVHAIQREQLITGICGPCWEDSFRPGPGQGEGRDVGA